MKILTIGAGAYGLALSSILIKNNEVVVYSRIQEEIENLKNTNKNEKLFGNMELPKNIKYTNNIENIEVDMILLAVPTNIIEQELKKLPQKLKTKPIIITSKGIYKNKYAYEIVKNNMNTKKIYIISGPGFAIDIIKKQRVTLTLAGKNTKNIKKIFENTTIKIEETKDIIGTEICGTLKNIFAIGAGILEGLEASESTKASYLTKIINETKEIIKINNGKEKTILLSCGIGDIILTCTCKTSRNYTLGYKIGKKEDIEEYIKNTTIEGLNAIESFKEVQSKTIQTIYSIIKKDKQEKTMLEII